MLYETREWTDLLPPPPREVYDLMAEADAVGLWFSWARYAYHSRRQGGRYKVTLPRSRTALYTSDDLDAVRAFLRSRMAA